MRFLLSVTACLHTTRSGPPVRCRKMESGGNVARILTFTTGPTDWQALLADPEKQWRTGYSAKTLAYCWEAAEGFPPEVAEALQRTDEAPLGNLTPVLAIPEFKVP